MMSAMSDGGSGKGERHVDYITSGEVKSSVISCQGDDRGEKHASCITSGMVTSIASNY